MIILLSTASASAARKPAGEIRIRIYDYASVAAHALKSAEQEAARLLGDAGVRVHWLDCEILRKDRPTNHPCAAPLTATDIHLRIYDRAMASRVRVRAGCVGYSLASDGFDSIGAVLYHRAVELKRRLGIPLGPILGAVIAHEVGHLLLEEPRHADSGVMSAHWSDHTLLRISRTQLGFSRAESRRLEAQLMLRIASDQRIDDPGIAVAGGF